ncbi:MAG: c-type cytochrome [bacterium]|nr:c-type cytochrome [bacterium]
MMTDSPRQAAFVPSCLADLQVYFPRLTRVTQLDRLFGRQIRTAFLRPWVDTNWTLFRADGLGALCLLFAAAVSSIAFAQQAANDSLERDYASELPRAAPLEVEQALESFTLRPGFRIELVASEPLISDPVAFAFDAAGRLFVVEMRDYSEQESERLGSLALLEDRDGDGRMDFRSTYVDGLSWPTAVWPWKDGALVAEPPNITWYRDTDGDGVSDRSETWFSGFHRSNVQGLVNSLRWGVDGYIHGATSSAGAEVRSGMSPEQPLLRLSRSDFAIDPLSKTMQRETGGGQHGMSFNRWGDKFVSSNSDHLQQVVDLERWLGQVSAAVDFPDLRRSIAVDGPQAEVFRTSPIEPWRIVRTRLRVGGLVPGPVEGGGRAAGYFTGATGVWIMDAEAGFLGGRDVALVCDVGSNLVHRKMLLDQGLFWSAVRVDEGTELLTSSDTWFRPVQLGDGPDGGLYIADMYREVIEHPKSLPPIIKKHLDLTSGRNRGRIWRVTSATKQYSNQDKIPVSQADAVQRIDMLQDDVSWRRRMASQMLIEEGVAGQQRRLRDVLDEASRPEAKILALHIGSRLGFFDQAWCRLGLRQEHPRVLEHAIRLAAENGFATELIRDSQRLCAREEPRIQLEIGKASMRLPLVSRASLLRPLIKTAKQPLVRAVVAASSADLWELFSSEILSDMDEAAYAEWLKLLLPEWSRRAADDSRLAVWLGEQLSASNEAGLRSWLKASARLESQADIDRLLDTVAVEDLQMLQREVERLIAADPDSPASLSLLRLLPSARRLDAIRGKLAAHQPESTQLAAIQLMEQSLPADLAHLILPRFSELTPRIQLESLRLLVKRPAAAMELLSELESERIRISQVPVEIRQQLERMDSSDVTSRARRLFGEVSSDRARVVADYAQALDQPVGSEALTRGRGHFERLCAQCHQLSGIGVNVGAALTQIHEKSPRQLLEAILDPNREVDPRYISYSVLLDDDRTLAGVIGSETASQIVLVESGGKPHTIRRSQITRLKSSGISLMPEGMEQQLTPTQMQELIVFLRQGF